MKIKCLFATLFVTPSAGFLSLLSNGFQAKRQVQFRDVDEHATRSSFQIGAPRQAKFGPDWLLAIEATGATIVSYVFILSPMVQIRKLLHYKHAKVLALINPYTLNAMLLNCSIWTVFALLKPLYAILLANLVGIALAAFYLSTCWVMKSFVKGESPEWGQKEMVITIGTVATCVGLGIASFGASAILGIGVVWAEVIGYVAMLFNVAMFAAPLTVISTVVEERNSALLPPFQCGMQFIVSILWVGVGISTLSPPVIVPNSLGLLLAAIQLGLVHKFPARSSTPQPSPRPQPFTPRPYTYVYIDSLEERQASTSKLVDDLPITYGALPVV